MFERIAIGWELAKQSLGVLRLDKELLLFPLMSGVACTLVLASFAIPLWATGYVDVLLEEGEGNQANQILGYVVLFAFYFANYFVIVFFNSALVACALYRFRGGDPTVRTGLAAASTRLPQILAWAAVSATVGLILRVIESRSERVGQIVASLIGMAWSAVTYFVVPVIVVERVGPIDATKRSLAILKRTWGEALSANFGVGFIVFIATLIAAVPVFLGIAAISAGMVAVGIACIAGGIILLLLVSLISSALNSIILGALYLYAAEEKVPEAFDRRLFQQAFVHK